MKPRNQFIVKTDLAKAQLEICENLYQEKEGRQAINDYADKVGMPYTHCKGCESETPTIIEVEFDTCAVCGGQKEIQAKYLTADWLQTDGSDNTLQYGRKINGTTWEYMEWTDKPWDEETKTAAEKLADLNNDNWRRAEIDLKEYSEDEIWDALSTYGYEAQNLDRDNGLIFTQGNDEYSGDDATQLACECLFELEM